MSLLVGVWWHSVIIVVFCLVNLYSLLVLVQINLCEDFTLITSLYENKRGCPNLKDFKSQKITKGTVNCRLPEQLGELYFDFLLQVVHIFCEDRQVTFPFGTVTSFRGGFKAGRLLHLLIKFICWTTPLPLPPFHTPSRPD